MIREESTDEALRDLLSPRHCQCLQALLSRYQLLLELAKLVPTISSNQQDHTRRSPT